jgi:hypothetical protein
MPAPNTARRKAAGRLAAAIRHGNPILVADARAELATAQGDYLIDQLIDVASTLTHEQINRLADVVTGGKRAT